MRLDSHNGSKSDIKLQLLTPDTGANIITSIWLRCMTDHVRTKSSCIH
jgi:hypothetical protein